MHMKKTNEDHRHEEDGHEDHGHEEDGHEDHAREEDEHEDHGHGEDDYHHDHGDIDPHVWIDPILTKEMAGQILASMIEEMPEQQQVLRLTIRIWRNNLMGLMQSSVKWQQMPSARNSSSPMQHTATGNSDMVLNRLPLQASHHR